MPKAIRREPAVRHDLMRLEEVAAECRAPVGTVRHWIRTGLLQSFKIGRRRCVRRSALEAFFRRAGDRTGGR